MREIERFVVAFQLALCRESAEKIPHGLTGVIEPLIPTRTPSPWSGVTVVMNALGEMIAAPTLPAKSVRAYDFFGYASLSPTR
jgi:hypothetical protein